MLAAGMAIAQVGVFVGNDSEINCAVAGVVSFAWKMPIVGAELSGFELSFVEAVYKMLSAQTGIAVIRATPPSSKADLNVIMFSPKCEWRGFHSYEIVNEARSEFCSIEHTFPIRFEFVAQPGRRSGSGLAAWGSIA